MGENQLSAAVKRSPEIADAEGKASRGVSEEKSCAPRAPAPPLRLSCRNAESGTIQVRVPHRAGCRAESGDARSISSAPGTTGRSRIESQALGAVRNHHFKGDFLSSEL